MPEKICIPKVKRVGMEKLKTIQISMFTTTRFDT